MRQMRLDFASLPTLGHYNLSNISNIMYHKLYKRSAEKWQKVAIWQKTQKKQKSVYS